MDVAVSAELYAAIERALANVADTLAPLAGRFPDKIAVELRVLLLKENGKIRITEFGFRETEARP